MERPNISMTRAVHSPTAIDANKTVRVPLPYDNLSTMFDVEGGHPHFPFQLVTMGRTHATLRVSGSEYLLGRLSCTMPVYQMTSTMKHGQTCCYDQTRCLCSEKPVTRC